MTTDCLLIGFNDTNFADYVAMVKGMGPDSGAYRDLRLAYVDYQGTPYRALDLLTHFYNQAHPETPTHFHNMDFLSPAILYLGTYLARRGFRFDYINLFQFEQERLRQKLLQDDILTVAITTTLYVSPQPILEIVAFIRQYNPTVKILVGGPYILNQSIMLDPPQLQQVFQYLGADVYVINQDGETALVNILTALQAGGTLAGIPNIAYRDGDTYVRTAEFDEQNHLEKNLPDYRLFPRADIGEFVSLRTAKSCPFHCAFCGYSRRAGQYRYVPVSVIEQELNALCDLGGITTLTFLDDTLNVPKQRFKDMLRMMIRNRYEFRWNAFYRCDHGDTETIGLMRDAGCEGVFLGVESGSDTVLTNMQKTARRKDYLTAIPLLKQADILTHANLVIGFPGETEATVQETLDLLAATQPDFFRAQLWYADPITPVWEQRDQYGLQGSAFSWSHHTMDSQTACTLIETLFFPFDQSLWLPQAGFELWSLFYLQRRGMTLTQVKKFVRVWHALLCDALEYPGNSTDSLLMDELRRCSQFDHPELPAEPGIQAATAEELDLLAME